MPEPLIRLSVPMDRGTRERIETVQAALGPSFSMATVACLCVLEGLNVLECRYLGEPWPVDVAANPRPRIGAATGIAGAEHIEVNEMATVGALFAEAEARDPLRCVHGIRWDAREPCEVCE